MGVRAYIRKRRGLDEKPGDDEVADSSKEQVELSPPIPVKCILFLLTGLMVSGTMYLAFPAEPKPILVEALTKKDKVTAGSSKWASKSQNWAPGNFSAPPQSVPYTMDIGFVSSAHSYQQDDSVGKMDARIRRKRTFSQKQADDYLNSGRLRAEASDILVDVQQPWRRLVRTSKDVWRIEVDESLRVSR